jgi:hypothetical protein
MKCSKFLFFSLLAYSTLSFAQYDPCKEDTQSPKCKKHLKSQKCEQKYLPVQDFNSYSKAFADYREILKEYSNKHPDQQELIVNLVLDSQLKYEAKDQSDFSGTYSNSNTALRLNWAIDLYKRSKGEILFIPGTGCATGSHCLDQVVFGNKSNSKVEKVNSPYFMNFCGGAEDLERRINLLKNNYAEKDSNCLKWIQTHPYVDGEAAGDGLLSSMQIGFQEDGKLTYDSKNISIYENNNAVESSDQKLRREYLKKDKSEFTLSRSQNGELQSFSFTSVPPRMTKKVGMEFNFKYVDGQCMPYQKILIDGEKHLIYPDINECVTIDTITNEYYEMNWKPDATLKDKLKILYENYFSKEKLFADSAPTWCENQSHDDDDKLIRCQIPNALSILSAACSDYVNFLPAYKKHMEKDLKFPGEPKSKARAQ